MINSPRRKSSFYIGSYTPNCVPIPKQAFYQYTKSVLHRIALNPGELLKLGLNTYQAFVYLQT